MQGFRADPKTKPGGNIHFTSKSGDFCGNRSWRRLPVFTDKGTKVTVSKDVNFDECSSNTDVMRNTNEKFISFGLPSLEAEYLADDSSTAALQNTEKSLDDMKVGEDRNDHQDEDELDNSLDSASYYPKLCR